MSVVTFTRAARPAVDLPGAPRLSNGPGIVAAVVVASMALAPSLFMACVALDMLGLHVV